MHYYKKTDSTLRGNIGSELTAMADALGHSIVFIPAFPDLQRTTVNGVQYVDGVELQNTEFARDPFNPIRTGNIAELIHEQSDIGVRTLAHVNEASLKGNAVPEILVADAATNEQLLKIGQALKACNAMRCLSGCAGFAGVYPQLLGFRRGENPEKLSHSGILLVSGSLHPRAAEQCRWAADHLGYRIFTLTIGQLLQRTPIDDEMIREISAILRKNGRVILRNDGGREKLSQSYLAAAEAGIPREAVPGKIAAGFGACAERILQTVTPGALVIFGGDTLFGIADAVGCECVLPQRELAPGVVLSQMRYHTGSCMIVSKAGGFGSADVLSAIEDGLNNESDG